MFGHAPAAKAARTAGALSAAREIELVEGPFAFAGGELVRELAFSHPIVPAASLEPAHGATPGTGPGDPCGTDEDVEAGIAVGDRWDRPAREAAPIMGETVGTCVWEEGGLAAAESGSANAIDGMANAAMTRLRRASREPRTRIQIEMASGYKPPTGKLRTRSNERVQVERKGSPRTSALVAIEGWWYPSRDSWSRAPQATHPFSAPGYGGGVNDPDFAPDEDGLEAAVSLLLEQFPRRRIARRSDAPPPLPDLIPRELPERGRSPHQVLRELAPLVIGEAMPLDSPGSLASMNPPTPWVTWAAYLWDAAVNQNLLHSALSPVAGPIERRVIEWVAPYFGMGGGHLVPGSTIANLTGLWAAREVRGVREVVASEAAHVSVRKAANLLGLRFRAVPVDEEQRLVVDRLGDLAQAALVLTAGTSACGAVDPLDLAARRSAAWVHVDAAWAGPLRFTDRHRTRLDGIEGVDSVGFSGHKLLFQPKESAVVLFRDVATAHAALSYQADYLAQPNVGLLGSHGATAVPLLMTLLTWGRQGLADRIERCLSLGEALAEQVHRAPDLELWRQPTTGIVVWRVRGRDALEISRRLKDVHVGTVSIAGSNWLRSAIANPMADPSTVISAVRAASAR